jgi:tungstate transport system permease protein
LSTLTESFVTAGMLVVGADPQLLGIVALSLKVSLSAVFLASCLGLPIGAPRSRSGVFRGAAR